MEGTLYIFLVTVCVIVNFRVVAQNTKTQYEDKLPGSDDLHTSCENPQEHNLTYRVCNRTSNSIYPFGTHCNRTCTNSNKTDRIVCVDHIGGGKWIETSNNCSEDSRGCSFSMTNVTLQSCSKEADEDGYYPVKTTCKVNCTDTTRNEVFPEITCLSPGVWDYQTSSSMRDHLCAVPCPFGHHSPTGYEKDTKNCTKCADGMTTYKNIRHQCTSDLMCYQCADSSGEEGKNDCQTYVRTMKKYRKRFYEKGQIIPGKYVKNCTGFTNNENNYCMVARVELRGNVISFMRDCTDGLNFGLEFTSSLPSISKAQPDNQTTCGYNGQGYLVCITICQGDFCNGPLAAASMITPPTAFILAAVMIIVWHFQQ